MEIRGPMQLPARREDIELETLDGLTLVGEIALPLERMPVATLVTLHPLPTAGGFMDSHILRKAAGRLPALADLAVLRFNTRGTTSPRGTSEGAFDGGRAEAFDLAAAMDFVRERALPRPWLVGWSFGTELALKYGRDHDIEGIILLSPPLHRATAEEVAAWAGDGRRVIVLVPEFDDYLRPEAAAERFAAIPEAVLIPVEGGKHLWVGENQTRRVLTEVVAAVNPDALPLPTEWTGQPVAEA
ncbi:alpha/beta hydrolase [Microbacterium hominis]|uniref:Alpha/beta hydrolase n=1 Tax=Microbacterium hominis TaxID=162426 RepID=A0A7D4Q7T5_9MICO|nr:alpha/beta hydrolase [Microbacterium hominis]QKJ19299.1 alpha/beta hydrolase [Microbacterium hominis]